MNLVSFSHLFIFFVTQKPLELIEAREPFTLARVNHWMACDNESRCGQYIYDFLKFVSDSRNKAWIASKVDPLSIEPLIKSELIKDLRKLAEVAVYILAVHNGEIVKLFQFSSSKRLFRIDKRLMNPETVTEGNKRQVLKELKAKSKIKEDQEDVLLELIERNGTFYLEVSGNHKRFKQVENALNKMHSRVVSVHLNRMSKQKCYHIRDSTILIPECGNGLSTQVTFATYQNNDYSHAHHVGKWKSVLDLRNSVPNQNWRVTERQRYETQFMKQIQLFRQKQHLAKRDSKARFFGELKCSISPGLHYLFNIPETLHNTFETVTLHSVQKSITQYEETLSNETSKSIIQEAKNYNSRTLLKMEPTRYNNAPLKVMPLHTMRAHSTRLKQVEVTSKNNSKKSQGVHHTFFPIWQHGADKCKQFALMNGFAQVAPAQGDFYTTISVNWRQRELAVDCTREGIIKDIHHRTARWFSSTIKRNGEGAGDDIRTYLKTYASLDEVS